jgi:hypothetical protein
MGLRAALNVEIISLQNTGEKGYFMCDSMLG